MSIPRSLALGQRQIIAWLRAFRFISLIIAVVSCGTGIAFAWVDGGFQLRYALLVMIGGVLLQSGVNLVNDYFEYRSGNIEDKFPDLELHGEVRDRLETIIYITGLVCFAAAVPIGLYFVSFRGLPMLILGVVGICGGYFYTCEPFNYKRRGLAVIFVFFLMGLFMISGSHYALSGLFRWDSVLIGLPISALVSHLLLCNELRDWEYDTDRGHRTLTVRIGYRGGVALYAGLLIFAYLFPLFLWRIGELAFPLSLFAAAPLLIRPARTLGRSRTVRRSSIPWMMLHHGVYGILYIILILNAKGIVL